MAKVRGEAHTVREDLRIRFTKQLHKLREDDVTEVRFPSTLTNIERKFLHQVASELGLISKSHGKGDARFITVTRRELAKCNPDDDDRVIIFPLRDTAAAIYDLATLEFERFYSAATTIDSHNVKYAPSVLRHEVDMIQKAHSTAQMHRENNAAYLKALEKRRLLPSYMYREAVCRLVKSNQIVLISGETGCGKTTQVPQFLLDDSDIGPTCRMAITQPRRISAVSVATRVAKERGEAVGKTVGYNIRLESERSLTTQCLFVTPGLLLKKILSDPHLEEFSLIIIDEAHERDRFTEYLLIVIRNICARRSDLKLLLMSATMHTDKLSDYFGGVPHIHMGGSIFPVQEFYLEHVLRFTDFDISLNRISKGAAETGSSTIGTGGRRHVYTCTFCKKGAFKSSEEFATHVALCNAGVGMSLLPVPPPSVHTRPDDSFSRLQSLVRRLQASSPSVSSLDFTAPAYEVTGEYSRNEEVDEVDGSGTLNENYDSSEAASICGDEGEGVITAVTFNAQQKLHMAEEFEGSDALLAKYQQSWDDTQIDYDLVLSLLKYVFNSEFCQEGSILVFLPGWDDISRMFRLITSSPEFSDSRRFLALQLHSGIPKSDQDAVFEPAFPGQRKIILSTNIAETSVTIDGIAVVIDSGRAKEKVYDPHIKLAFLKSEWIAQSSVRQRVGRAGRTRAGVCFHLFSRRRYADLAPFADSELLRMPLEELALQTSALNLAPGKGDGPDSIRSFLNNALDPPHALSVQQSVLNLIAMRCLNDDEKITSLGRAVSSLSMDPRLGRSIIISCVLGCAPAMIATVAAMAYRDPFVIPFNDAQRELCRKAKLKFAQSTSSDHVALLRAVEQYSLTLKRFGYDKASRFCDEHFLSSHTMSSIIDISNQLHRSLEEIGISPTSRYSQRNNENVSLLMALVSLALYPNFAVRRKGATVFTTEKSRKAKIHPSSLNSKSGVYKQECAGDIEVICYDALVRAANVGGIVTPFLMMLNTTPVSLLGFALSCSRFDERQQSSRDVIPILRIDKDSAKRMISHSLAIRPTSTQQQSQPSTSIIEIDVVIDDWLRFKMRRDLYESILSARKVLATAMDSVVRGVSLSQTGESCCNANSFSKAIDVIVDVLSIEQPAVVAHER